MSLQKFLQIFVSVRRFEDILKTSWRRMTKTNIFVLVTSEEVWRGEYVRYSKNKNKIKYTAILHEYKCGGLKSVCILRKIFSKNWMRLYFLPLTATLNDDLYCNTIKSFQGTIEFVRFHRWPFVCLFVSHKVSLYSMGCTSPLLLWASASTGFSEENRENSRG